MIDCSQVCGKIEADLLVDCNTKFVKGIEQQIRLINRCDILDFIEDVSAGNHCITDLNLRPATTGYAVTGLSNKQLFTAGYSINVNDDGPDDFAHTINIRTWNLTKASLAFLRELGKGADLVAVVLDKTDAANLDAYKIYGLENGLKISDLTFVSNENQGATLITLASREPDFESNPPYVWNEVDRATMDGIFAQNFNTP